MKQIRQFISYAHQDLSRKKIIQYAAQYDGVDMAELLGADEDRFPFVVDDGTVASVFFWKSGLRKSDALHITEQIDGYESSLRCE